MLINLLSVMNVIFDQFIVPVYITNTGRAIPALFSEVRSDNKFVSTLGCSSS